MNNEAYRSWFWEEAPFFRILPPLIFAVCCYDRDWYNGSGTAIICMAALVCLAGLVYVSRIKTLRQTILWLRFILLQCLVFWTGILSCNVSDITTRQRWLGHHIDSTAA